MTDMKTMRVLAPLAMAPLASTLARTALLLTAVLAVATPAAAADMKGEYGARAVGSYPAVPVPAPIPIPDSFNWYVRGDAGYSLKSTGNVSASGIPQVTISGPGDHDGPFSGSLGFGRYITPSLRAEFGLDLRNNQTIGKGKGYAFTRTVVTDPIAGSTDTHTFQADRQDTTNLGSQTFMANLYYDVKTGSRFTPYVGAGAGVSLATIKRNFSETAQCVSTVDSTGTFTGPGCSGSEPPLPPASGRKVENAWGPAFALMAGTSVDLTTGVKFDAGYRMMWQGSTPSIAMGSVMGDISKISAGARTDHELRMGLRWDIW
jgi:opacity protein-like surface antigen